MLTLATWPVVGLVSDLGVSHIPLLIDKFNWYFKYTLFNSQIRNCRDISRILCTLIQWSTPKKLLIRSPQTRQQTWLFVIIMEVMLGLSQIGSEADRGHCPHLLHPPHFTPLGNSTNTKSNPFHLSSPLQKPKSYCWFLYLGKPFQAASYSYLGKIGRFWNLHIINWNQLHPNILLGFSLSFQFEFFFAIFLLHLWTAWFQFVPSELFAALRFPNVVTHSISQPPDSQRTTS